jgi:hypothetical protein
MLAGAALAAACAAPSPSPSGSRVALLDERPRRPHDVVARLEVRGDPGVPVEHAYGELRWKADALGADAVVKTAERSRLARAPARYEPPDRPLLGNAYPGPLRDLEPGAFPPEGRKLKVRGKYYVVEGLAIRYVDSGS